MVITDELSNDTTLLQLRCKMGLRVGMLLNRKKKRRKRKNKARIIFICGNHIILSDLKHQSKKK